MKEKTKKTTKGSKKFNYKTIKTFEDACKELELDSSEVFSSSDTPDEIAYMKLKTVTRAINHGWTPAWNNSNQRKWWPYFNLSSGFGFSGTYCNCVNTYTAVGSRLCFESEEKARYAGTQFKELYKQFLE